MVHSESLQYPSWMDLARQGDLRAIAAWLNQVLLPHGIRARLGSKRPGSLKLLVEFTFPFEPHNPPDVWREHLIRLICHRLWTLNSPLVQGVNIAARFADQPKQIVWQQTVRIVTPASRSRQQQTRQLRSRIRQTSRRKTRLRNARTLLVGGPAVAAVVVGGILGYTRAPVEQTDASASSQPKDNQNSLPTRPDSVRTALETIPVVKHNQVANPQDPTVTLMFSGDVTLADHYAEVAGSNHAHAFAQLPEYQQADVAMVNLENPLTRATLPLPGKQFNFKAEPESVNVLTSGGVDIVAMANNHTMDYDAAGLTETLSTLDGAGVHYVGAGKDLTEARRPKIIDVKGQRIAYFSYWGEEYGAEANKPGVNNIREERIAEDIRAIRDQVDWVVVNYHWGQELADFPADWQVKLAHFTIDHGADVIVGHHPHVLQGTEIYKGRAIAYSLGNFIFGGNSRTDYDTAVLKVALNEKQMKVEVLPVEVRNYQPKVAQGSRATEILNHITQISGDFKQPMQPSVVLDAQSPPSASPEQLTSPTPGSLPPAPTPLAPDPTISPDIEPTPPALPTPNPNDPSAGTKGQEFLPAPPDALPPATQPYSPDGSTEAAPSPTPIDPNNLDVLPGYGGNPAPDPAPSADPLTSDPYATPDSTIDPTSNSTSPTPSIDPAASPSPQLPSFSQPGNAFTNSPSNTPLQNQTGSTTPSPDASNTPIDFDQTPQNIQGAVPTDAAVAVAPQLPPPSMLRSSTAAESVTATPPPRPISFQIQATAAPEVQSDDEPFNVSLAAPMMW